MQSLPYNPDSIVVTEDMCDHNGHMNVNYNFLVKVYSELTHDQKIKFNKNIQILGSNISKAV